ncbi:MAG: hypothetical protein ABIP35_17240 [Ginsengibacter sp.]
MAEITLSDYVGFIFSEITRARDHADRVSKEIALVYAQDEILKSFSVPRFKIPEMELTIPVIISGAKFSTSLVFNMQQTLFSNFITNKMKNVIRTILLKKNNVIRDFREIIKDDFKNPIFIKDNIIVRPFPIRAGEKETKPLKAEAVDPLILSFYEELKSSTDPANPENLAQLRWAQFFNKKITENNLLADYKTQNPNNELFIQTLGDVVSMIKANTIVSSTKIDNLMVDPETNVVKNQSSDTSIFIIKAKIMEEGIFIRTIKDEDGTEKPVVEFE